MSILDRLRLALAGRPKERIKPAENPQQFDYDALPGPGRPILLSDAEAELPRAFDYEYNLNSNIQPRAEFNFLPSFFHLHAFYQLSPESRVCNSLSIEEILGIPWDIVARPQYANKFDKEKLEWVRALVEKPDPMTGWDYEQWMRAALMEESITDAKAIYPLKSKGGELIAFQLVDGQTIKPIVSIKGERPLPPNVAYVQFIHGRPYAAFAQDELVYAPTRPRVWTSYGESRVEEILVMMGLLTLFGNWNRSWFTEGNMPDAAMFLDAAAHGKIDEKKLLKWQETMDEISGANSARRRIRLFPWFAKDVKVLKDYTFNPDLPEWITRWIAAQFCLPPHLFVKETNRATAHEVGRGFIDKQFRRRLMGIKRFWDKLLSVAGASEFEFVFRQPKDFTKESVEGLIMLCTTPTVEGKPMMTVQEVREELGFDASTEGPEDPLTTQDPDSPAEAIALPTPDEGSAPGTTDGGAASPPAAPAQTPATPAPAAATKAGVPSPPVNRKAVAHAAIAARARLTAKMLKEVRPFQTAQQKSILRDAEASARRRGITVKK